MRTPPVPAELETCSERRKTKGARDSRPKEPTGPQQMPAPPPGQGGLHRTVLIRCHSEHSLGLTQIASAGMRLTGRLRFQSRETREHSYTFTSKLKHI